MHRSRKAFARVLGFGLGEPEQLLALVAGMAMAIIVCHSF